MFKHYHKIPTIYKRRGKKLLDGDYINSTVKFLKNNWWWFTEKIDGTNIAIYWDGYETRFYGRKENSEIPEYLLDVLNKLFAGEDNSQKFEQLFGSKKFILYGEGFGEKINNGNGYIDNHDFILFDVFCVDSNTWLQRENVEEIAFDLDIDVVPIVGFGTLDDGIDYVKKHNKTHIGKREKYQEGIVCRPVIELLDKNGERVIVKIKYRDFN